MAEKKNNITKKLDHLIEILINQILEVNEHIHQKQEDKKLSVGDKIAITNFGSYHLMILSILLHEVEDYARERFPESKDIIDWASSHYFLEKEAGHFKLCKCLECDFEQKIRNNNHKKDKLM